ncbi:MAG: TetR/AcrR family transcriptional regulator [Lachnospiraceae bacterium]
MGDKVHRTDTKIKILKAAKSEFLSLGYEKTTLRTVCRRAGVTTGALYFFFENKADLFRELVGKMASDFETYFGQAVESERVYYRSQIVEGSDLDGALDSENECRMMRYIYPKKEEFLILMTKAKGSEFEFFYEKIRKLMISAFEAFFNLYVPGQAGVTAVYAMIPLLVAWRMDSYLGILREDLTLEETLIRTDLIARYASGGWNAIVESVVHPM